ncbi:YbaB/EbfC family nucleoid-associated protein [Nonomuraea sp. NPDC050153]|uniref:YbaB/EbfC family nucleoid-associated protein n=1 Tax=Nonomuraea sp. NPDC050153 TaxID=3364359 RepID=UPI0037AFEB96
MLDPGDITNEELERVGREAEQTIKRIAGLQERLAAIRGTGSGADGRIVVNADPSGRIDSIDLHPRVMRLASAELSEELLRAVNAAQDDCARQTSALMAEIGVGSVMDKAVFEKMERHLTDAHTAFLNEIERYGR